ncbi:hypothetical protein BBI10_04120 [Pseudomonas graminis]|uniref:DUF3077 domain-containing protein n=1 Tax=Pseudomonas graminis TaxID=158627 RepID=A0A1C2ED90_9PSED|nr:hypothetical protein BBI10_04120 [Pseudomonas graminis]
MDRYEPVNKSGITNAPTEELIKSMSQVAATLRSSFTLLLSAAVRLAEAGQDEEASGLVKLAKVIEDAEDTMRIHTKDASEGKIVKLNLH